MASKGFLISLLGASFVILTILTETKKESKKGDQVKGIADLKKYLQHFGYLNYQTILERHANDDDFDDLLEDALKTYQANFHLKTTGTLDDDTITTILRPRCGVPDIVNGTNWMQSHKHKYGGIMFHLNYNFFRGSPKWPRSKTRLTYGFDYTVPTPFRKSIARAFGKWAAVSHFIFLEASYDQADLTIAFVRADHGDKYPFGGRGGSLARSFGPTDGRLHFNADELWTIGAMPGHIDVG